MTLFRIDSIDRGFWWMGFASVDRLSGLVTMEGCNGLW